LRTLPAALRAATQLFLKILHAFLAHAQEAATGTIEIEDDERDGGHDDREERRYDEVAAPEEPAAVSDQRHRRDRGEKEHGKNGGRNMIVLDHEAPGVQVDGVVQRLDEECHGIRGGVFLGQKIGAVEVELEVGV